MQNSIYYNGIYSFIGGGLGNNIVYLASFIGAGNDNQAIGAENDFVGAGNGNTASGASAFVGAGGEKSGGSTASGEDSFVGAGDQNSSNALGGFIGAGYSNTVGATSIYGVVAGGSGNNVGGVNGAIGGGYQNVESANDAVIAGGYQGTLNAEYGAIGGGFQNLVSGEIGTVAGGQSNTASGTESAVGGGVGNIASGQGAVVPGGLKNTAKGYASFAGGAHSLATATGTFVWSDDATNATQVNATTANSFLVRASGGVTFYSSLNLASGVQLNAGSGTWSSLSDRNAKTDVLPVDDESILAKVAALPVSTWRYKTEEGARHVGPMAQDFYAAFGVGEDDRHITSLDEDGVALAAIKALNQKLAQKLADKDREIAGLNDRLTHLEATVVAITRRR